MTDLRLATIQGQHAPALGLGNPLQTGGIGESQSKQCVIALEQMCNRPRGDGHAAVAEVLRDFGQAAGLGVV